MASSRHTPPRRRERRFLLLFGLAVAALAALIGLVALDLRGSQNFAPPESAEVAAKRHSPENAFYTLKGAWELLPPLPLPGIVKRDDGRDEYHHAEVRSIGDLLDIDRPDDDPILAEYLANCGPAIAMTREAFDKDFFLYPEVGTPHMAMMVDGTEYVGSVGCLGRALTGCMLHAARFTGDDEQVRAYLRDAIRLGNMLTEDGAPFHYAIACRIPETALRRLADAAVYVESPDTLRAMIEDIRGINSPERPVEPYLEFMWRMLDNWAAEGFTGIGGGPVRLWISWKCRCYRQYLAANPRKILEAACLSSAELAAARQTNLAEFDKVASPFLPGPWDLVTLANARERLQTAAAGATIAIALELHRRDQGCYPDSLDALSPGYLASVPTRTGGVPFIYRLDGGDYWLYEAEHPGKEHLVRKEALHCPSM